MDDIRALLEAVADELQDVIAPTDLVRRGRRRARHQVLAATTALFVAAGGVLILAGGDGTDELVPAGPGASTPGPSPTDARAALDAACGHPGRSAEVPGVRLTVRHADCDLTGVTLTHGGFGVAVPVPGTAMTGNFDGPDGGGSFWVSTEAGTGDVTFDARGVESLVQVSGVLVMSGGPAGTPDTPVAGSIEFDSPDGSSGGTGTDADGRFTLDLLPGTYVIRGTTRADFDPGPYECTLETGKVVLGEEPIVGLRLVCPRK